MMRVSLTKTRFTYPGVSGTLDISRYAYCSLPSCCELGSLRVAPVVGLKGGQKNFENRRVNRGVLHPLFDLSGLILIIKYFRF